MQTLPHCSLIIHVTQCSITNLSTQYHKIKNLHGSRYVRKKLIVMDTDFKTLVRYFFLYVLLTVHLSIFILVINQLDAQNFCFTISLFHASTCFEHMCSKHVEA